MLVNPIIRHKSVTAFPPQGFARLPDLCKMPSEGCAPGDCAVAEGFSLRAAGVAGRAGLGRKLKPAAQVTKVTISRCPISKRVGQRDNGLFLGENINVLIRCPVVHTKWVIGR
jgi:hypothetical protein